MMSLKKRLAPVGLAIVVSALLAFGGCDEGSDYANSCPRINQVGDASWDGEALRLGVWLQDLEEDPVDLLVTGPGGVAIDEVLGHGSVGLTSLSEYPGQVHELVLPGSVVSAGDSLEFVPEDIEGCVGAAVTFEVPAP